MTVPFGFAAPVTGSYPLAWAWEMQVGLQLTQPPENKCRGNRGEGYMAEIAAGLHAQSFLLLLV